MNGNTDWHGIFLTEFSVLIGVFFLIAACRSHGGLEIALGIKSYQDGEIVLGR